jgi:hypothetical protein
LNDSVARFSKELKVDVFLGSAKFIDAETVEVDGKRLRFKKGAVCTGSRPAVPPGLGLEQTGYLTNKTVFQLTELRSRLSGTVRSDANLHRHLREWEAPSLFSNVQNNSYREKTWSGTAFFFLGSSGFCVGLFIPSFFVDAAGYALFMHIPFAS